MQKEWKEEELNFIKENYIKMSVREIANYLGRSYSSIENKKGRLGLKGERKYNYDMDFFKRPLDEFSAYWLGFIYADGYISSPKEFAIQLKRDDFEHLKKLNVCLKGNIPVTFFEKEPRYIKNKLTGKSYLCQIRIFNKEMVLDLNKLGVYPKKSFTIKFPTFNDDWLTWCFIRGYFDGDGSIYFDKGRNQLKGKITSGSLDFKNGFSEFLNRFNIKTFVTKEGFDCGITGKESHRIFFYNLYNNANIYLDRKYKKYQTYKHLLWPQ